MPRIEGKPLETVCFVVGPLRNLTTLISAVVAFHPNCQVLYQGYNRLESNTWVFHMDRFEELIGEWLVASTNSNSGPCGVGSIVRSHAFSPSAFTTYLARYEEGAGHIKEDIKCFFLWRHPSILIDYFEEKKVNISQLLLWDESIRFLTPIRNPLDCLYKNSLFFSDISNKWMHSHYHTFTSESKEDFRRDFLCFLIKCYNWIFELQARYPDRFFYFFEEEFVDETFLRRLSGFLRLSYDDQWVSDVLTHFTLRKSDYQLEPEWIELYLQALEGVVLHKDKLASYANERSSRGC